VNLRTSLSVFRAARDWRPTIVALLAASGLSAWLGRTSADFLFQVAYLGFPLVAIYSIANVFEYAQRAPVFSILAQRAESDQRMMWSLLRAGALVYVSLCAVLLVGLIIGGALNSDPSTGPRSLIIGLVWLLICGLSVATTSTMSRSGTAGFAILWMAMPFVSGFVQRAVGYSNTVRDALNFLFPPIDAVIVLSQLLKGEATGMRTLATAQFAFFPLLCFAIMHWRLKALANPDLPRVE
jgi:hypothetical protein